MEQHDITGRDDAVKPEPEAAPAGYYHSRTNRIFVRSMPRVRKLKFIDGGGFEIHDGIRYDWKAGDVIYIPPNTLHQHHTADPERPDVTLTPGYVRALIRGEKP